METNEVDAGRAGSSSVEGGSRAAGPSQKAAGKKNWNAAVLILVLLLVGAVGAHSLLTVRRCRGRGGPYCGGTAVGCEQAAGFSFFVTAAGRTGPNECRWIMTAGRVGQILYLVKLNLSV
jgi:hypothetical protein